MASHRHLCNPAAAASSCLCHCCYTTYSTCHHHPLSQPPSPAVELHLHSTPSHFHHSPTHVNPPYTTPPHLPNPPQNYPHSYFQEAQQIQTHTTVSVSSLLRRVSALESALRRRSSSSSQSLREAAASTIQSHFRVFLARRSRTLRQLRDLASIKSRLSILKSSVSENTHFDYEALSHKATALLLKLDSIKGGDPMIRDGKSSVSRELINFLEFVDGLKRRGLSSRLVKNARNGENNVKFRVLQGKRTMGNVECRGLKSVNVEKLRELANYDEEVVEAIENSGGSAFGMLRNQGVFQNRNGDLVKRHGGIQSKYDEEGDEVIENSGISMIRNQGVFQKRNCGLVKKVGGVQSKGRKSVSFAENGNVYRVYRSSGKPDSNGDCDVSIDGDDSIDDERELVDNLCRAVEEIGVSSKEAEDDDEEKDQSDNGGSSRGSDGDRESRNYPGSESKHVEMGGFVFSAPLPVKMETRGDFLEQRKTVKLAK
ncbi:BAG family molecular chaperone regulator 8 [Forsythia ovata]|uniref:BAG family molecular chaperone regulator 8 n=1 Tax=Forsythia ovata TaxID=205694 RepID=A0ABD1WUE4_9LAMI